MAEGVFEITDGNFEQEVAKSSLPVLVDFWAEWCMPCRMLAPTIEELAREFTGKIKVGKLDTDANQQVASTLGISAIPTVILFKNGMPVSKFVGVRPKKDFVAEIQKAIEPV